MKTILMVCTANMCRSPMAEGLLRHKLEQRGHADKLRVASAGIWAEDGCAATAHAVRAMAERGIDISGHRSRNITEAMLAEASLVLTMTRGHAEAICAAFPAYADKVRLLSEMSGPAYDVQDPVGQPLPVYQATADELARLIEAGYARIVGGD